MKSLKSLNLEGNILICTSTVDIGIMWPFFNVFFQTLGFPPCTPVSLTTPTTYRVCLRAHSVLMDCPCPPSSNNCKQLSRYHLSVSQASPRASFGDIQFLNTVPRWRRARKSTVTDAETRCGHFVLVAGLMKTLRWAESLAGPSDVEREKKERNNRNWGDSWERREMEERKDIDFLLKEAISVSQEPWGRSVSLHTCVCL